MKLKNGLKLLVGLAFVAYVLKAKLVDFGAVGSALFDPARLGWSALCLTAILLIQAVRWGVLCRVQGLLSSFRRLAWLNWAGGFVGLALFGSAGGDVVKAFYLSADFPGKRARAALTVFVDRLVGSLTYFALLLLLFPLEADAISAHPELWRVAWFVMAFCGVGALGTAAFFLFRSPAVGIGRLLRRLPKGGRVARTLILYRNHPRSVIAALAYSFATSLITVLMAAMHGRAMGLTLPMSDYLIVVPLGVLASYFSLLPFGIGVGQVVYFQLFTWLGADPQGGAALCTLTQLHGIFFYLTGVVPFVRMKRAVPRTASGELESERFKRSA